ncbi:hypothetical protein HR12_08545 [Microbacterium sp. SUBG005]|nr:hypothetical protein HR12_08545 [Microbacterium sp. SUBG005]
MDAVDRITLTGVRAFGYHGVYPNEKRDGQEFVVDATVFLPLNRAAETDDVVDTVHYGELAERIAAIVSGEPVDLLERLAARIADEVLRDERVEAVTVTVHKPAAPHSRPLRRRVGDDHARALVSVRLAHGIGEAPRTAPVAAVIALGANLGERAETLAAAVAELRGLPLTDDVTVSAPIETVAVTLTGEDDDAPRYLNAVATLRTRLAPTALLAALHRIEARHGRVRRERWGDRTLDLDLIAYGDEIIDRDDLVVPHPRAHERDFVLVPWLDVDPDAVIPGRGRVDDLLAALRGGTR